MTIPLQNRINLIIIRVQLYTTCTHRGKHAANRCPLSH